MIVIGHRITGIKGQRFDVESDSVLKNISTNAVPTGLKEGKNSDDKKKNLIVEWKLVSNYDLTNEKKLAELEITGELIVEMESKEFKTAMQDWKDKKTMPKEQLMPILQGILNISQVEAIILARELNLPSPINLVKIKEN